MGVIEANRAHGKGTEKTANITIQGERVCGNGRFSNVYSAHLLEPERREVAVKNAWEDKTCSISGPKMEIELLSMINHTNIVSLLYHFTRNIDDKKVYCLVLDYLPEDMQKLKQKGEKFDLLDAKLYSYQLFSAVAYLAKLSIVHLDIKPANIIMDHQKGLLKLADFGNAQKLREGMKQETSYQVTRYYRPPELLFGTTQFTTAIDVWSAACVVYEFAANHSLFKGTSTRDQVRLIVDVFGYPSEPEIKAMKVSRPRTGRKTARGLVKFTQNQADEGVISMLKNVFVYSPSERFTAEQCLEHPFFQQLKQTPPPVRSNGSKLTLNLNKTGSEEENKEESSSSSEKE